MVLQRIPAAGLRSQLALRLTMLLAGLVAGCRVSPPVVGFRPIYPPVRYGFQSFRLQSSPEDLRTLFVKVDSLQPWMKWKPFAYTPKQREGQNSAVPPIERLGYDLKIWREDNGVVSALVYAREGLPEPCHRLEEPLQPATKYCWSVRARFEVNGQPRITQWSFSQWPWSPRDAAAQHASTPRGLNQIPFKNYYRFETP
jgi:hypothetical protein